MSEKAKYQTRRKKLKENLFRLLKDEPEGIPKAFLWNQYHSKTKEPVAAHYYGVTKMHDILGQFEDILTETMYKGRPTIQLLEGTSLDSSDSEDEVQIPQVSSTKKNDSSVLGNNTSNSVRAMPASKIPAANSPILEFPMQVASQSLLSSAPIDRPRIPFSSATLRDRGVPVSYPVLSMQQPLLSPAPLLIPVIRPSLQQVLNPYGLQYTAKSVLSSQSQAVDSGQHLSGVVKSDSNATLELVDLSDDSDCVTKDTDYPSIKEGLTLQSKIKTSNPGVKEPNVKQDILQLLRENPGGIKKTIIWDKFRERFKYVPSKEKFGVNKLTKILLLFDDCITEVKDPHGIEIIKCKEDLRPNTSLTWGMGATALSNVPNRKSLGNRSLSSSTSSLNSESLRDSTSRQSTPLSVPSSAAVPLSVPSSAAVPFIDLTKDADVSTKKENLIDLTQDQQNTGFISLTSGGIEGDGFDRLYQQSEGSISILDPISTQMSSVKSINMEKFEPKEIRITPLRIHPNPALRQQHLEDVAKECIELLANANEFVSLERVEQLILQRYRIYSLQKLQLNIRFINQISCMNEHSRMLCKVNAYIEAFIRVRNISTLCELQECLSEFAPDKTDFNQLKLGPIQRLPLVYKYFKFPTDIAEVPKLTTIDVLDNLKKYSDKYNKWSDKLVMEEFLHFMVEEYQVDNAYVLGVRIRSLPLAMQVLKKSQRDMGKNRRDIAEAAKEDVRQEMAKVFRKFFLTMTHIGKDGQPEIRQHYLKMRPEIAMLEIFSKFQLLLTSVDELSSMSRRKVQRMVESIHKFITCMKEDKFGSELFHLAICISDTELREAAMELLAPPPAESKSVNSEEQKQPPARGTVVDKLMRYLERCTGRGALTLQMFDQIEVKLMEDFGFPNFSAIGCGRFLEFLLKEAKQTLEECGGTSLGSGHHDNSVGFGPSLIDVLEFICQSKQCGKREMPAMEIMLCDQFSVKEVKRLGLGNMSRLVTSAEKPGKHHSPEYNVRYESVLCGSTGIRNTSGQVGILGHQSRESALACLHNCPLLEDLAAWSHWELVFEPQFGKLKDFVQSYGGRYTSNIQGGSKIMTTDILALETRPGHLVKLVSHTSIEYFVMALQNRNATNVCGHLMSLVVSNKSIENSPIALLANHVKSALLVMHAEGSSHNTMPGGPPEMLSPKDVAVDFVLDCLNTLPIRTTAALASQVFLDPLGSVVGSTKSKRLLLVACRSPSQKITLQSLGCLLGISEWTRQIYDKCQPPDGVLEDIRQEDAEEFFEDIEEIEDSDEEDADALSTSFLSDEEDDQEENKEESLIVVDEASISEDEHTDCSKNNKDTVSEAGKVDENNKASEVISIETDESSSVTEISLEMQEEVELTDKERLHRECQRVVNDIRRDEFGIGVELNEDGQRLMAIQHARLGRSLDRLSKDLYSKDTHFVLELIQNADDNSYADELLSEETDNCPSVKFIVRSDGIIVLNNEKGFKDKDVRALCDVGSSTKGKHKAGYIGQKGIGFKSVFRVTDSPEVHSGGYHINFDVNSGPTGYILPHWKEDTWDVEHGWMTKIVLPLKEEMIDQIISLAGRFEDIHPSLLLFLHRLQEIIVQNQVDKSEKNHTKKAMRKRHLGKGVVEISHSNGTDRWLVVKKILDASKISLQAKSGVEVESTEIAIAFPLKSGDQKNVISFLPQEKQHVFAFLPLRSYGFKFIVQGDFDVPSSREDVDKDSPWNQWIRNEIHTLFIDALENFKSLPEYRTIEAVTTFLQFVPVEDEIMDFFRPVAAQILQKLKAKPCVPTQPTSKGTFTWKIPSQTVNVKDRLILEVVSPELLKSTLNLHYLHQDVADKLNPSLTKSLGIESLTTEHLLLIGKSLVNTWEREECTDAVISTTSQWLACVYRSLDDFHDNNMVYDKLREMRIIPLVSLERVSTSESTVFFPLSDDIKLSRKDPMNVLQQDLKMIHPLLVKTPDNEVNSQVQKILSKIGVCQLSPKEVICQHIIPVFKSDKHKSKEREVLVSYIIYVKEQLEQNSSLVNVEELSSVAMVKTNVGMVNAKETAVHFTPYYGNKINLSVQLPGYKWTLLDAVYLSNPNSQLEVQKWRQFFIKLGVTDSLAIRKKEIPLSEELIKSLPWEPIMDVLKPFSEGCYIEDWCCEEFYELVKNNNERETLPKQLQSLFYILLKDWEQGFSNYLYTKYYDKDRRKIRDVETSFHILLKTLAWIPAISTSITCADENTIQYTEKVEIMQPSCLYMKLPDIMNLLAYTVMYVDFNIPVDSNFGKFLGFKYEVGHTDLRQFLIKWGSRQEENKPTIFCTTNGHLNCVYEFISQNFSKKDIQDLLHDNPVIFLPFEKALHVQYKTVDFGYPRGNREMLAGQMLNRKEVWWNDPSGLFIRHHDIIQEYHLDIGKKWFLERCYRFSRNIQDFFLGGARIETEPKNTEYGQLLILIGQVLPLSDITVLSDVLHLYAFLGKRFTKYEDDRLTKKQLQDAIEVEKQALLSLFKGQKILATKNDTWVSLEDKPMIADNKLMEKMFKNEKGVHFVQMEPKKQRSQKPKGPSHITEEDIIPFFTLCGIKKLSECLDTNYITPMFQPCPKLQQYIHLLTPIIQRYLYNKYYDIYQAQIEIDIVERLKRLQCAQVNELSLNYSLKDTDISVMQKEKCFLQEGTFYFHRDHIESFSEINTEVAKFFSNYDTDCTMYLKSLLSEVMPIVTGATTESIEDILDLHDCDALPETEELWHVTPPIMPFVHVEPEPEVPELELPATEYVNEKEGNSSRELKSWPPMSEATGTVTKKVSVTRRDEELKPSKIWPPPEAPGYVQSTKQLPSQFKVVADEEVYLKEEDKTVDGRKSDKSMRKSDDSDRKPSEGRKDLEGDRKLDNGERLSSEGPTMNRQYSRLDSENKGTKRKMLENEQHSELESKRPNLPVGDENLEGDNSLQHENIEAHQSLKDTSNNSAYEISNESNQNTCYDDDGPVSVVKGDGRTPEHSGKRRHLTRESDSPPSPKKSALIFDDPVWGDLASDYVYEELGSGAAFKNLPEKVTLHDKSDKPEIGRWGEHLVYHYLLQQQQLHEDIVNIHWCNEADETGKAYDLEVELKGEDGNIIIYIEVKSTLTDNKDLFEISSQQIELAQRVKERFHIYRVFNAGDMEKVKLVRIDNLSLRMDQKQVKLCMLI